MNSEEPKDALNQEEINQLLQAITPAENAEILKPKPQKRDESFLIISANLTDDLKHDGNVRISGKMLRGSQLEATGSVEVLGGIIGGTLTAGGMITTPFIEFSRIRCRDSLLVSRTIFQSDILCVGGIYLAPNTGSAIIGGITKSMITIQTDILGHPLSETTRVELITSSADNLESNDPNFRQIVIFNKIRPSVYISIYGEEREFQNNLNGINIIS